MAENKHTAGPWSAAAKPSSIVGWPIVSRPSGRVICDVAIATKPADASDGVWSAHYVEVEANARLIAAAPDLLAALIEMESEKSDYMTRNNLGDPAKEHTNKMARAAILRATQPGEV